QRPLEQRQQSMRRAPSAKLRLHPPLAKQPSVILPLVSIFEAFKNFLDLRIPVRRLAFKLVGYAQSQHPQSQHILWIRSQNVAADRLSFFRFVEVTIQLGLSNRLSDPRFRDGLQLQIHEASSVEHNVGSTQDKNHDLRELVASASLAALR